MLNLSIKKINESLRKKTFSCQDITKSFLENISKKD
jgi:Asp-tRNA(Asn)/Glu-tRNA(Gln) amidotransferase A subunit family amidase